MAKTAPAPLYRLVSRKPMTVHYVGGYTKCKAWRALFPEATIQEWS